MINYKEKIREIFEKYQFELANMNTLNKVEDEICDYLYDNGYNDNPTSINFKPLIPNVNYKISIQDIEEVHYFQLELLVDGIWYIFN